MGNPIIEKGGRVSTKMDTLVFNSVNLTELKYPIILAGNQKPEAFD